MPKIELRDPSELTIHPALKLVPDWAKDDPRGEALSEDIRQRGIDQPLLIDSKNRVIDGRKRVRAAKQLQLAEVPVIVRGDDEVLGIVVGSLMQRAHWTKSQLAYILVLLLEDAFQESERRRLANLAKNPNVSRSVSQTLRALQPKSVAEWAEQIGIGTKLFRQAREIHKLFRENPDKRDLTDRNGILEQDTTFERFYEPRIMRQVICHEKDEGKGKDEPYGLGAVKAGIMASLSPNTKSQREPRQLELFDQAADTFVLRLERTKDAPEVDRILDESLSKLSEDGCLKVAAAIKRRLKK